MTRKTRFDLLCLLLMLLALTIGCENTAGAQGRSSQTVSPTADPTQRTADSLDSPFAAFRLGVIASPVASIDGGLDVTFPRLTIGKDWVSRVDVDLAARFNSRSFGSRRDASVGLTFCQVFTPGGVNRGRLYAGAGFGYFVGPRSGIGSKVFVGTNLTRVIGLEVEGQFPGDSTARLVVLLRISAL